MLFRALLIVGFTSSAFLFFRITREDIKLLSLRLRDEIIFDIFFLTTLSVLIGARIVYVAAHFGEFEGNPFKIILFTHFPGLSLIGGILGGVIFLRWFLKGKNILNARLFDSMVLSSLPLLVVGFLGKQNFLVAGIFIILAIFLFRIYRTPLFPRLNFPGAISLSFLSVSSIVAFISTRLLTSEQVISIIVLIFTLFFFTRGLRKGSL